MSLHCRLELTVNSQHIAAEVIHFRNGTVLQASTNEWSIRKHLYRATDTSAYVNLARVNYECSNEISILFTIVS